MSSKALKNKDTFWGEIFADISGYISDKWYMIATVLTTIGSYGFWITHYSISADDLNGESMYSGALFAQGRMTATIFNMITQLGNNKVFFRDLIGTLCMFAAAILFCIVFDRAFKTSNRAAQTVFSCIFLSYPLHMELFRWTGTSVSIGLGCVLACLSALAIMDFFDSKKLTRILFAVFCLFWVSSWYESVLILYVATVFAILLLEQIKKGPYKFSELIIRGLYFAVPLIVAFVLEFVVSTGVRELLGLEVSDSAANGINWELSSPSAMAVRFVQMIKHYIWFFTVKGMWYLPLQVLIVAMVILFVAFFVISRKKKQKLSVFLCISALIFTVFSMSLLQGGTILHRTSQAFSFVTAFAAYILIMLCSPKEKNGKRMGYRIVCTVISFVIFLQASEMNRWFTLDHYRFEEESRVAEEIGYTLEQNYDLSMPVVFVGEYELSDYLKEQIYLDRESNRLIRFMDSIPVFHKYYDELTVDEEGRLINVYQQTGCTVFMNGASYYDGITSGILLKFFKYCGYDNFLPATQEQYDDGYKLAESMPCWPEKGSIVQTDEYILVKIGNQ